jgi:hypothetical protein
MELQYKYEILIHRISGTREYVCFFFERRIKFFCSLKFYKDFFRDFEIFITNACVLRNFILGAEMEALLYCQAE